MDFDRLSHAYILTGSGAPALSKRIAAAAVCDASSGRPCGRCRHCRKAAAGIHPDIITISRLEDKAGILVDQARNLRADAYVVPNEADRKVYIIDPADKMNPQAQNALLKVLEEPPSAVIFLLVASNPNLLLETVRSRCVLLSDVSEEEEDAISDDAREFYRLLRGKDALALAEAILRLDLKKEKGYRENLSNLSRDVQRLAMEELRATAAAGGDPEPMMKIIEVFRRLDDYMAVNVSAGNLAGLLLEEFVPLLPTH